MGKIKGKFIVEIETDFSDTESDIETAKYQLREDLLELGYMNVEVKLFSLPDVRFSLPDVRNKLTPVKNLIAMINNGLLEGTVTAHYYIQKEIKNCEKSIKYLSGNET